MDVAVVNELAPTVKPSWRIACKEGGERLDVSYDPAADIWSGNLTLPGLTTFAAGKPNLLTLLQALIEMEEHARQPAPPEPPSEWPS